MHDAAPGLLGPAQPAVQAVEEPIEELGGVRVRVAAVLAVRLDRDRLEELVRRNLPLERPVVPDLAEQLPEALDEQRLAVLVVVRDQKVVPQLLHARQRLPHAPPPPRASAPRARTPVKCKATRRGLSCKATGPAEYKNRNGSWGFLRGGDLDDHVEVGGVLEVVEPDRARDVPVTRSACPISTG